MGVLSRLPGWYMILFTMKDVSRKTIFTYTFIIIITLLALALIRFLGIAYPLEITTINKSGELAVVGEGKVDVIPDTAYVDVGIQIHNAQSVESVQKTIEETNNKIIESLSKMGIGKSDIKTSNYSIYPNYSYENNSQRLLGYEGNVSVNVKVTDTKNASKVLSEATAAGANQVFGLRFTVENPDKYREEARNKAIENAKSQAGRLASSLGIRLGRVVNIVESTPGDAALPLVDKQMSARSMGAGAGGANIEPGSQTLYSTVTLYFEKR